MMSLPQYFVELCMLVDDEVSSSKISDISDLYHQYGKNTVYEFAKKKKILPFFAHNIIKAGCDVDFWQEIHDKYLDRNLKVISLLDKVFIALYDVGIEKVCVSENFAAVLSSDVCLGCFCSGDVDFYCDDVDVDKLNSVMESMGFYWSDRHTRKKSFAREYKSLNAIGEEFWLNFQWKPMTRKKSHLYDQRYILKRYHTLFDEVEYYKDTHIKYFKPEVAMYLNCIHIASGHYYILPPGLRLFSDIDRPARKRNIDWESFMKLVQEDKLGIRTDMILSISKKYLNTPIGDYAFTKLVNTDKFNRLFYSLIDKETSEFKFPKKGIIPYLSFLIKVELMSDGTNLFAALLRRLWVLLIDWS